MDNKGVLEYEGCNFFRQRLILSTLSGRSVRIKNIRQLDDDPGLKGFEINLLKLLDRITNGSKIDINVTGTSVFYQPGLLHGGDVELDCGSERGLGYFLELLVCLAPFCKKPLKATLVGVTNSREEDPSVDLIKNCWLPVVKKFLTDSDGLELKILKRGLQPDGGGCVEFFSPICRELKPCQMLKQGKVKKIRGVAFTCRVSPTLATRIADSAKRTLKRFTGDVYIHTDQRKGPSAGNSPGFGISLYAETSDGIVFGSDAVSNPVGSDPVLPEDIGVAAAHKLFDEIYRGGSVDSSAQSIASLFMVLCRKDVSKLVIGPISNYNVYLLRHLRDFFQTTFKIETFNFPCSILDEDDEKKLKFGEVDKVLLTCVGVGYSNMNKMLL